VSRWYRAYVGTVKDDKLAEVAVIVGCSRSVAIAAWHTILESAAETNDGGRFDTTPRRVAATLNETLATSQALFLAMEEISMISDSRISAWSKRQYESDSSTERSRKHRKGKSNGDATLQGRRATPPEADTDSETDEDTAGAASSGAGLPKIDLEDAERRCAEAAGADRLGPFAPMAEILLARLIDIEDVLVAIRSRPARNGAVSSWKFYAKILQDKIAERTPAVASTGPPKTHVMSGTPEWDAWVAHEGRSHPADAKGGWYFPTRWPPKIERAA
jgi:hypothetical protein